NVRRSMGASGSSGTTSVASGSLRLACSGVQELAELPGAPERPAHAPGPVVHGRVNVGEDEVLPVPAAPHHHLPERVADVAVPVPDAIEAQTRILVEDHVVAAEEPDVVLDRSGGVVGPDLLEVADQPLRADVVEMRGEDDPGPLQGQDLGRLDVAAIGADD